MRVEKRNMRRVLVALLGAMALGTGASALTGSSALDDARAQAIKVVVQIQRADYEGDRAALKQLPLKLLPFIENKELAARVRYWRGFAFWRRAINGFNETPTPTDLEEDLQRAVEEFETSATRDPGFADAKIAMASSLGYLLYLHQKDQDQVQAYVARIRPMLTDVRASAPNNPRLYWVLGPMYWSRPVASGGGQDKAFEAYQKGLDAVRLQHQRSASDPLDPAWGEPELLMNRAWSNLNRTTPDLDAAEQDARAALQLVPYWHYVRDILMPQIQAAKTEARK